MTNVFSSSFRLTLAGLLLSSVLSYVVETPPLTAPSEGGLWKIPPISSSTGLKNEFYSWRGQRIRYIASGPANAEKSVVLVHGLFVNADHWRRTINELGAEGYRTYAIDLLGSGYSSKPNPRSAEARILNGENGRFGEVLDCKKEQMLGNQHILSEKTQYQPTLENVKLGTESGGRRVVKRLDLRHPLLSCYNFYTWAEQISDFTRDVVFDGSLNWPDGTIKTTSLVGNSKGTIVALQAVVDTPQYYSGVCAINPTYREMHQAEMRFPTVKMPIAKMVQTLLRRKGRGLYYNIASQRNWIKNLLNGPYSNLDAIDDDLLSSLMEPLNDPNAAEVVFDELSYTAGPLFEQLLQDINGSIASKRKNLWVCYGENDPWLSPKRVESLVTTPFTENDLPVVEKVIAIEKAGHCPHDERPLITNSIILDFLRTSEQC
jgi:pimeloyl-ACP methyl ester carboxylesterase